jgi:hypothetical protein
MTDEGEIQMDSAQWLAAYDQRLADTEQTTAEASSRLQAVTGHAVSPRGEAEVTVGAGGALVQLTLSPTARALEVDELARLIMDTARQAQSDAGTQVAGVVADLYGDVPVIEALANSVPDVPVERANPSDDEYFSAPEVHS